MSRIIISWSMRKLIGMIVKILLNRFDCFIVIEGNRGLGKSTLAIHLARGVAREMKKIGSSDYKFNWRGSLVYTKKETKQFWHKWKVGGIADEMINVTFNRDFYSEEQKDIIKMMNMNRDHCNFFISCVPQFQTLDSQIKNLCKLRITVVRRGFAIIQTPNRSIYSKDKWDQAINEKIEREWISKGIKNPHYTKLTTFRGILKFPALTEQQEKRYQEVKDAKRNLVAREDMGIIDDGDASVDPIEIFVNMLVDNKIRNTTYMEGYAIGNGMTIDKLRSAVIRKLKERGIDHRISGYYWDKKARENDGGSI